ncbi:family 78 glycoside hydrolase catalytic domain [Zhouia sp. PK063]|uniref:family 78 glycoside hydrolase catalytic domain n=1 Tax=Zhouia sp. PK063 TaxID=3373602 RepID=UPI0037A42DA3
MKTTYFKHIITGIFLLFCMGLHAQIATETLYCENRINPLGLDNVQPKFTWVLSSKKRDKEQSAYQIQVSTAPNFSKTVWDSKKVTSNSSVRVAYQGAELQSLQIYYWRIKVWDENGKASKWSETQHWQMGVLHETDWKANWITVGYKEDAMRESPAFRKEVSIPKTIKHATAIITSHGMYEGFINGEKIGDAYLTPGWTSYNKRLQYQVYDVTKMLHEGKNALGALLGSGWYRSPLAWGDNTDNFGSDISLLFQINITYTDGSTAVIGTDSTWKNQKSEIVNSEIYNGEIIDTRKSLGAWKTVGYNDAQWFPSTQENIGFSNLVATYNEPITKHETFTPIKMLTTPEGDTVIDFGQNLVGWVQAEVEGKVGDSLIIDHAEVLDKNGNFYTANLRAAKAEDVYVLNGKGKQHFEPHFTWQGFRYIRIKGNLKNLSKDNFKAVTLYSNMRNTGSFQTSNALLNQLQHNIQWGQRGNFLDVPTDCPQRDERLGWTGDAQVFSATAAYNMHVDNFFSKWMKDVAADQMKNGSVPHVIPNVLNPTDGGSTGWADVSTIVPWNMYVLYGNKTILKDQYTSMKAWVDYMKNQSHDDLWNTGFHFGDWLFYRPDDDTDGRAAITDKYLIAQCFYAHSTQLLINTAKVLGKTDDVKQYTTLLERIKKAFVNEYMTPNGRLVSGSQTAYVLALKFDMLPEELRAQAAKRLAENIKSYNYHLTTGFLGTPYLCAVLSKFGYHDLAYTLLMQQNYPSWLYPVTVGATTIWERWDGRKPDGSFQTPAMNSFNHYAYGAIGDWMYTTLAGINTSSKEGEIGYKKIILTPHFDNSYVSDDVKKQNKEEPLTEVNGSLDTYYGKLVSHWAKSANKITYQVTIPVNTTAEIHLPVIDSKQITEDGKSVEKQKGIQIQTLAKETILTVGSGNYTFTF